MTTRQELLDQWHQRLAEAEQDCERPDGPSWSLRVRLRLYRFLLAMYGETDWPGPKDDVDNAAGRAANVSLLVAEPDEALAGKEPRTRAEILKGLRNVKGLSEELAPPGPLMDGLLPASLVVIAAFKKHPQTYRTVCQLRSAGFRPVVRRQGGSFQIFLAAADASVALRLLKTSTPIIPREFTRRSSFAPPDISLLFMSALLPGIVGLTLSAYVVYVAWGDLYQLPSDLIPTPETMAVVAAIAFTFKVLSVMMAWVWWNWRKQSKRLASGDADAPLEGKSR